MSGAAARTGDLNKKQVYNGINWKWVDSVIKKHQSTIKKRSNINL